MGRHLRKTQSALTPAKILGPLVVGDGAKVGSNAVVVKDVPPGATAVGIPAKIIEDRHAQVREAHAARLGFSAYGLTSGDDDPVAQAIRGRARAAPCGRDRQARSAPGGGRRGGAGGRRALRSDASAQGRGQVVRARRSVRLVRSQALRLGCEA